MKQIILNPGIWTNERFRRLNTQQKLVLICAAQTAKTSSLNDIPKVSVEKIRSLTRTEDIKYDMIRIADEGFIKYCGDTIEIVDTKALLSTTGE